MFLAESAGAMGELLIVASTFVLLLCGIGWLVERAGRGPPSPPPVQRRSPELRWRVRSVDKDGHKSVWKEF